MNLRKELLGGFVFLFVSVVIVLGSFSLALIETNTVKKSAFISTPTSQPTPQPPTVPPGYPTPTLKPTLTPSVTETPVPPTNCPPPHGWQAYTTHLGDTLDQLAAQYSTTKDYIMQANCMVVSTLLPNTTIYLPGPTPSPTPTPSSTLTPTMTQTKLACNPPPYGWIPYMVRPGDTLYHLAWAYGTTIYDLQVANCMDGSTFLATGNIIYVPHVATRTLSPTPAFPTPPQSPTIQPTGSKTPTPTNTPTYEPTVTPTMTRTSTPTATTIPSCTPTPTSTLPLYPILPTL